MTMEEMRLTFRLGSTGHGLIAKSESRPQPIARNSVIRTLLTIALLLSGTALAHAEASGDPALGARAYRPCAACHSLQPGVHLSGPSLANRWGKPAAAIRDYGRYTKALKDLGIVWNAATLDGWLDRPDRVAPGTTMTFRGIEKAETRANLITFLKIAMGPDGANKVVEAGLLSKTLAEGRVPPILKAMPVHQQVTAIRHCGDGYRLTTADGMVRPIWETNLRIKIDTGPRGPTQGKPVLLASGQGGDRFTVVFADVSEIARFISRTCD